MSRTRGICGLETGRTDAGYAVVGGALVSGGARTGTYKYQDKKTVAAAAGFCNIITSGGVPSAALFQIKYRFYFQPVTFPSVTGLVLGEMGPLNSRLEMDTTGKLRFNGAGLTGFTAPAYAGQTIIGHWYQARIRLQGYNKATTVAISGRVRATLEVFDCGLTGTDDPSLLLSYETPNQPSTPIVNISWDSGTGFYGISGDALQEMAGKVTNFQLVLSTAIPGPCGVDVNGDYSQFPSQTTAYGPACSGSPATCCTATNGVIDETGSLNGLEIGRFLKTNTQVPASTIELNVGNTVVSGNTCTREINYDDIYWDIQDGADVPLNFADEFPLSTYVQSFPVLLQGTYDEFTPANHPGDVDDIPMTDTNTVTANVIGKRTTYTHGVLATGVGIVAEHLRVYIRWNGTTNNQEAIIYSAALGIQAVSVLCQVVNSGVLADFPFEGAASWLTADAFNLVEYGARLAVASTTNLHSVFMEVLTGAEIFVEPIDPFAVVAEFFPEAVSPNVEDELTFAVSAPGFRLANQGEEINVPVTWRLERLDLGPRSEEHLG